MPSKPARQLKSPHSSPTVQKLNSSPSSSSSSSSSLPEQTLASPPSSPPLHPGNPPVSYGYPYDQFPLKAPPLPILDQRWYHVMLEEALDHLHNLKRMIGKEILPLFGHSSWTGIRQVKDLYVEVLFLLDGARRHLWTAILLELDPVRHQIVDAYQISRVRQILSNINDELLFLQKAANVATALCCKSLVEKKIVGYKSVPAGGLEPSHGLQRDLGYDVDGDGQCACEWCTIGNAPAEEN
ncbi:hypothetical protein F4780DRAFT_781009 [Xylariomycetidae sp. FL0641]|nr:hypothetical protein F4780DRAFT_781009 [Xylariomycetidae sp. FL0641]